MSTRTPRGLADLRRWALRGVRPLVLTLLVGSLAAPGAAGAHAAAGLPALTSDVTLTAPATGYLRVRLTRTLDLNRFHYLTNPPTFTGARSVGLAFLPDRIGSTARSYVVARVATPDGVSLVEGQATGFDPKTGQPDVQRLLPGTYRLFFLTHGGGSVRMRLPGQPSGRQRLVASRRVAWSVATPTAPADATGSAPAHWETTLDIASRQPGYSFAALWFRSTVRAVNRAGVCYFGPNSTAEDRDKPLCRGGSDPGAVESVGPRTEQTDWLWHSGIFDQAPGRMSLRAWYVNGGQTDRAGALLFFLPQA